MIKVSGMFERSFPLSEVRDLRIFSPSAKDAVSLQMQHSEADGERRCASRRAPTPRYRWSGAFREHPFVCACVQSFGDSVVQRDPSVDSVGCLVRRLGSSIGWWVAASIG